MIIEKSFSALIKQTGNHRSNVPVEAELHYDSEADPLAVRLTFSAPEEEDNVWYFSLDLLKRGVASRNVYGDGDVRFQYMGASDGGLMICLRTLEGHADIWIPQVMVVGFLNRVAAVVKEDKIDACLDSFIEGILNS